MICGPGALLPDRVFCGAAEKEKQIAAGKEKRSIPAHVKKAERLRKKFFEKC